MSEWTFLQKTGPRITANNRRDTGERFIGNEQIFRIDYELGHSIWSETILKTKQKRRPVEGMETPVTGGVEVDCVAD